MCTCFCWHSHWLLILSSSMLNRTQSHMCVRLYLPMFLIRVRLIILIKIDSLIVLAKCCPLLHSMLKLFSVVMWPVLDWWPYISEGAFRCSLSLSLIFVADSSIKNSISLEQNQFFQRTQTFASPTDMASSGVWENVLLSKTPTFDGVCGMLSL